MATIASAAVRLFHIPLAEVLVDARRGDHTHFELKDANVGLLSGLGRSGWLKIHSCSTELHTKSPQEAQREAAPGAAGIGVTFSWANPGADDLPPTDYWGAA